MTSVFSGAHSATLRVFDIAQGLHPNPYCLRHERLMIRDKSESIHAYQVLLDHLTGAYSCLIICNRLPAFAMKLYKDACYLIAACVCLCGS